MKFFVPNEAFPFLNDQDVKWICEAEFSSVKECFTLVQFANGWLVEADESFNSFLPS